MCLRTPTVGDNFFLGINVSKMIDDLTATKVNWPGPCFSVHVQMGSNQNLIQVRCSDTCPPKMLLMTDLLSLACPDVDRLSCPQSPAPPLPNRNALSCSFHGLVELPSFSWSCSRLSWGQISSFRNSLFGSKNLLSIDCLSGGRSRF